MVTAEIVHCFRDLADRELQRVVAALPDSAIEQFLLFMELTRVIDYWSVLQQVLPDNRKLSAADFSLIQWGWNLAAARVLRPLSISGGLPFSRSTPETRRFAMTMLHQCGRVVLMKRAADMLEAGLLEASSQGAGWEVRMVDSIVRTQYLDQLEFDKLEKLESTWGRAQRNPLAGWIRDDIDARMIPLMRPWNTKFGTMLAYDAAPEVDLHFLAEATDLSSFWREEAGVHPSARVGRVSGADLTGVVSLICSLHLKHVRFAMLGSKRLSDVVLPQCLTIWSERSALERTTAEFCHVDLELVSRVFETIVMRADESHYLQSYTTPIRPLLIDLGNGIVLRPISSVAKNPFFDITALERWRNGGAQDAILAPREEWLRQDIYALFQGRRYERVRGNIKLRQARRHITDIDAAVLDKRTGELALFQIKWQDFFSNDVRVLRSKARNFTREIDDWTTRVERWISAQGIDTLVKTLRLKLPHGLRVREVYLFGISRSAARVQGLGFSTTTDSIALANWPQFVRARHEIGPVERVFSGLHETLRRQMQAEVSVRPLPATIVVSDTPIHFADLWSSFENEE